MASKGRCRMQPHQIMGRPPQALSPLAPPFEERARIIKATLPSVFRNLGRACGLERLEGCTYGAGTSLAKSSTGTVPPPFALTGWLGLLECDILPEGGQDTPKGAHIILVGLLRVFVAIFEGGSSDLGLAIFGGG